MKIRTGFVSNSSSSSFIVSAKKGQTPVVVVEIELPSDEVLETVEELNNHFLEHWGSGDSNQTIEQLLSEDDEYINNLYADCNKELKKGNVIHIGSVANDSGNTTEEMLYDKGLSSYKLKNGKVIQDCQG